MVEAFRECGNRVANLIRHGGRDEFSLDGVTYDFDSSDPATETITLSTPLVADVEAGTAERRSAAMYNGAEAIGIDIVKHLKLGPQGMLEQRFALRRASTENGDECDESRTVHLHCFTECFQIA